MLSKFRRQIIQMAYNAKEGHIPSALSILDIVYVLYDKILKIDPTNPTDPNRDRFILSKGHGALALYVVLAEKGFFPVSELGKFAQYGSMLGGHPDCTKVPGVEASTGSLGHGAAMSIGIAMALKIQKNPAKVYCLIGDGELNGGSVWESALLAAHHRLDNLCWIIDYNHSTGRALGLGDLHMKFRSFGWLAAYGNGHYHQFMCNVFPNKISYYPFVFIANTIKGEGISFMAGNPMWHHKFPNQEEYDMAMGELL